MRFLLIEDDRMIGESLTKALKLAGYAVDWAENCENGRESLLQHDYDLLLLDLGLPDGSGLALLQWWRSKENSLPALILTARDSLQDRVAGLDSGADDYILKPFHLEELEARIRSILRRREGRLRTELSAGNILLDPVTRNCRRGGLSAVLSAKEYALLYALMEKPGIKLSRMQLEEKIYGWNDNIESNAVEYHIYQLRKKFGRDVIRNIRGVGYTLGIEL